MTEHKAKALPRTWLNPATERLQSKITNLEEMMEEAEVRDLNPEQKHIVKICRTYLQRARDYIDRPFGGSKHPHLVWELLHRVDENLILLIKEQELYSKAIDVKTSFDLNIKEKKVREEWIGAEGQEGKFKAVLEEIKNGQHISLNRHMIRDALKLVNEQMDRTFWKLSINTLTSVFSAMMLGILMLVAAIILPGDAIVSLGKGGLNNHFKTLAILGLMGAYLSNLMTKEDFLYIRGGPFGRYFLHNLFSKPLMSAFATIFIFILEKSKLIFSINTVPGAQSAPAASPDTTMAQLISINVSQEGVGYAYAVIAVVSGFAADKILRNMIDTVLKRLAQKAEKTKDSDMQQ